MAVGGCMRRRSLDVDRVESKSSRVGQRGWKWSSWMNYKRWIFWWVVVGGGRKRGGGRTEEEEKGKWDTRESLAGIGNGCQAVPKMN